MKINYSYAEAAEALGIGEDFLHANISLFPHRGFGTRVLFSEEDLAEINAMYAIRPGEKARPAKPAKRPTPAPAAAPQPIQALKPRGARKRQSA